MSQYKIPHKCQREDCHDYVDDHDAEVSIRYTAGGGRPGIIFCEDHLIEVLSTNKDNVRI